MSRNAILLFFFILLNKYSLSQEYNDTVITKTGDTIYCQITLINGNNIFYSYKKNKGKEKSAYISRNDVMHYASKSKDAEITSGNSTPIPEEKREFIEDFGIIYSASLNSPPQFEKGQWDLYTYLENQVTVRPRDIRVFGNNSVVACYYLVVDSTGKVANVEIEESSVNLQGFDLEAGHLEEVIRKVIEEMPLWQPAMLNGESVTTGIYLPLKFQIEVSQIKLQPTKNLFVFKGRKR